MSVSHQLRSIVDMLAIEWELCSEDPFIFCYRIAMEPVRIFFGRFSRPE
jgi:hypothetical protein